MAGLEAQRNAAEIKLQELKYKLEFEYKVRVTREYSSLKAYYGSARQ